MARNLITSPQNERVKYWSKLQRDGNFRREEGKFVLEGGRLVKTALSLGSVSVVMHCPKYAPHPCEVVELAQTKGIEVVELGHTAFRKLAEVPAPQGLACLAEMPRFGVEDIFTPEAFVLVAGGVQEPGNLGSMIRTAAAAGATGFVALRPSADLFHARAVRGTMGAILALPALRMSEEEFLTECERTGMGLYAATVRGGTPYDEAKIEAPAGIVIGSEAHGVGAEIMKRANGLSIPMDERVESLNAAAAAAVLMFAARR